MLSGYVLSFLYQKVSLPFKATEAELKKFVGFFRDETSMKAVPASGADLENVHYIVPRTEESLMFGKKDKSGFFAAKTKTG